MNIRFTLRGCAGFLPALALSVALIGCGGGGFLFGGFSLDPDSVTVNAGDSFDAHASVDVGMSQIDQIAVTKMPSGWTWSRRTDLPSSNVHLQIHTSSSTPPGRYRVTVEATNDSGSPGGQGLFGEDIRVTIR